jgi:hypothetical protein
LSRYAPEDIDTDAKRKDKFLNGSKGNWRLKGICPRGNNKVVIIIFHVYDKCLFIMLELY